VIKAREDGTFVPPYKVVWHPDAEAELLLAPAADQVTMLHAAQKLSAEGPNLHYPHQSAVQGDDGKGFESCGPAADAAYGDRFTAASKTCMSFSRSGRRHKWTQLALRLRANAATNGWPNLRRAEDNELVRR